MNFRQFVVKVHSRCNLACDHCYMYEHADQTWRARPVVMADDTLVRTAERIAEHGREHALPVVQVILHGGEPLLAGAARLRRFIGLLRAAIRARCELRLGVQTNGILLDEELCELFLAEGVRVGISLDGDQAANDRHRRYAGGRSSHAGVVEAVRLVSQPRYRPIFAGLLCTIDPANDPVSVYEALRELEPPAIDFLLPHATWEDPPVRAGPGATPFADWLLVIHERWRREGSPVRVRVFDAIGRLAAGATSPTESLGLDDVDLVVVETDGAIEQADSLKTAFHGAPATGLNVHDHAFDDALGHPGFVARTGGADALCDTCRACPVVELCGGGLFAHRYRSANGFDNPSVYCVDLRRLVEQARDHPPPARPRPAGAVATHTLAGEHFDAVAAGGGSAAAIEALLDAQRSLRRARVVAAVRAGRFADAGAARAAWDALCDLDETHSDAVASVLAHPYVGLWVARAGDDRPTTAYLAGLALVASVAAGVPGRADVPVVDGLVALPGLGALRVGDASTATVESDPRSGLALDGQAVEPGPGSVWLPLRCLTLAGAGLVLDDLDPYRHCFHRPASARLGDREARVWQDAALVAGKTIERDVPHHLPAITLGLTTLTPLVAGAAHASATHRLAPGAIGVAATPDELDLAHALAMAVVHEVQHLKMGAVLDLFELYDPTDARRFRVGWRPDPRPIEGVLQGAYAHLAVVEMWARRRDAATGAAAEAAARCFAGLRDQTRAAMDLLLACGSLTALGRRWVERMRWAGSCATSC